MVKPKTKFPNYIRLDFRRSLVSGLPSPSSSPGRTFVGGARAAFPIPNSALRLDVPRIHCTLLSEPACCKSQLQSCDVTSHAFSIDSDLQRFVFRSLDIFGAPKLIQDLQNAQKLCWRTILLSGCLFMCILWLYIPHGSDNASVMAAAAVVSVGERSIDFIVALVAPGEKSIYKTLLLVFFFSKLSFK